MGARVFWTFFLDRLGCVAPQIRTVVLCELWSQAIPDDGRVVASCEVDQTVQYYTVLYCKYKLLY